MGATIVQKSAAAAGVRNMTTRNKVLSAVLVVLVAAWVTLALLFSHDSPCGPAPALPAGAPTMNAVVYRCYGSPDVVKLEQVAKPALADGRMLVKVHAASVNPLDWHYMRGKPYIMRPMAGFGVPKDIRLGVDFAGTVEAVGKDVTEFKPGDDIFGGADGAFAQYVTVRAKGSVALKPTNITYEQAAAVPIAAITALQALRDQGKVMPGQKVLINGASGGVGTFAVQIAKVMGADVTGVCSTKNVAMVQSLGANHVIDYTHEDFTRSAERYDVIIDNVGSHSASDYLRVLKSKGILVSVGGPSDGNWLGPLSDSLATLVLSPFVSQKMGFFLARLNHDDLSYLGSLMQSGKITPVIDRQYKLNDTAEAIRYLEAGHARGKVIIDVE
jgi:NADPH:quinone reductase-like Zn-dependent oxidoreductase